MIVRRGLEVMAERFLWGGKKKFFLKGTIAAHAI
jgi:hypothetical protein